MQFLRILPSPHPPLCSLQSQLVLPGGLLVCDRIRGVSTSRRTGCAHRASPQKGSTCPLPHGSHDPRTERDLSRLSPPSLVPRTHNLSSAQEPFGQGSSTVLY
jgi:hypothetical protein